jgi:transcriptional regulator with XRE-family HTH domain
MAAQTPSPRALGAAVRAQRHAHNLTLEELAGAACMHVTYVSDIEHGKSSPTVGKLGDIARAFDMRLSALIAEAEDRDDQ